MMPFQSYLKFTVGLFALGLLSCSPQNKYQTPVKVFSGIEVSATIGAEKDTSEVAYKIYSNINRYLREHLKDFDSYQPVSFAEFGWVKPKQANKIAEYLASKNYWDNPKSTNPKLDSLANIYWSIKQIGYTIKHKYRAKNGYGAYNISTEEFRLDTNFNVLYSKESVYLDDRTKDLEERYDTLFGKDKWY
jgi:hypothetical protein